MSLGVESPLRLLKLELPQFKALWLKVLKSVADRHDYSLMRPLLQ